MVTLSSPDPSAGKWMWTPPHSSITERTRLPFDPIRELCSLAGMETSVSFRLAWKDQEYEREEKQEYRESPAFCVSHQLILYGEDSVSCSFTVALLPRDHNHLRVAVLCREVDFCVGLLTYLNRNMRNFSQSWYRHDERKRFKYPHLFDVGTPFADDVFVELLGDGYRYWEAVFNLITGRILWKIIKILLFFLYYS